MKTKILNSITILLILMGISFSGKSQQINCPTCIDDANDDLMKCNGLYIVTIQSANQNSTKKLVVSN